MTPEQLRDLAKDIPYERPTAARRDALRSSLLVEAAESTDARPVVARRWPIVAAFTAGAFAAAAIALLVLRPSSPAIERTSLAQVTASSPDIRLDHQIVATETGSDEIVRVRDGRLALSIPAQRRGDRMVIQTGSATVEGDAGELEVSVAADQLQSVRVKSGTARVVVVGQAPVVLSAGQTWRASVITADLSPTVPPHVDAASAVAPTRPPSSPANAPVAAIDPPAETGTRPQISPPANAPVAAIDPPAETGTRPQISPPARAPVASINPRAETGTRPRVSSPANSPVAAETGTRPQLPPTGDGGKPALVVETPAPTPAVIEPVPTVVEPSKPASIDQQFQRGWALLKAGKAREAATALGAAADAAPTAPLAADARYFQAVALVRAGDAAAAERVLVQFLDSAPKSLRRGRAAVLLGRLIAERGDHKSARAWLESAAHDPDPAIAAAAKAGLQALPK